MAIDRDKIEEVIHSADIVAIIGERVALEKKGNDYKGLCPFHSDKNPSLSVSPKRNVYTCFSCHATGNVVTFVQNYDNISFLEALKIVAQKSGIELDINISPNELKYIKYHKLMSEATDAYTFYLHNTNEGVEAMKYLSSRNIDELIINRFQIGLSNSEGNLIVKTLLDSKKYLPLELQDVGLISHNSKNDYYYDVFKGRIIFPLKDLKGNIIGFSGRIYNTESNSKYMNSSENILFKKSKVLYNYSDAINEIKLTDQVIVFEGFMDVIAAYRANVLNAIATMGTSLTEEQVKIILASTKNVILCYDGDEAGIVSSRRAIKLLSSAGANIKVVVLPKNMDPDDYINQYGPDALKELLLTKAVSAIDYLYEIEKRDLNLNDPYSIQSFQRAIKSLIVQFKSKVLENYVLKRMSADFNITVEDVKTELQKISGFEAKDDSSGLLAPPIEEIPPIGYATPLSEEVIKERSSTPKSRRIEKFRKAEESIVYIAYLNRENCLTVKRKLGIEEFVDKVNRDILFKLYDYYNLNENMFRDEFETKLSELEIERFNCIINNMDMIFANVNKDKIVNRNELLRESIDQCVETIKKAKYQKRLEEINQNKDDNILSSVEEKLKIRRNITKIVNKKD